MKYKKGDILARTIKGDFLNPIEENRKDDLLKKQILKIVDNEFYVLREMGSLELCGATDEDLDDLGYELYEEPETDWLQVPIDAKVLVRDRENDEWKPRHFAGVEDGRPQVWVEGQTSHTTTGRAPYRHMKLAEDEDEK